MSPPRGPRPGILFAALLVAVASAYAPAQEGPFLWDDLALVGKAGSASHSLSLARHLTRPFWNADVDPGGTAAYFRPLVSWSYAVDFFVHGDNALGFHATNLLLHLIACTLVWRLILRSGAGPSAALLATSLFGLAPRLTEDVAWISGRPDLLATLFVLSSFLARAESLGRRFAAAVCLLAALLCKETAFAGLVALCVLEWVSGRNRVPAHRRLATLAGPAGAFACYAALRAHALGAITLPQVVASDHAELVAEAVGRCAVAFLDPFDSASRIGFVGAPSLAHAALGVAVLVALVIASGAAARPSSPFRTWSPNTLAALSLAVVSLAMVSEWVPLRITSVTADRFLYMPCAGLALAATAPIARFASALRPRRATTFHWSMIGLACAFGLKTSLRSRDYASEARFWSAASRTASPKDPVPKLELAGLMRQERLLEPALRAYEAALADPVALPADARRAARAGKELCLVGLGEYEAARGIVYEDVREDPARPLSRLRLAFAELRLTRFVAAKAAAEDTLALDETQAEARALLRDLPLLASAWRTAGTGSTNDSTAAIGRAELETRLLREHDAVAAWSEVVRTPEASVATLREGMNVLLRLAPLDVAARAVESWASRLRASSPEVEGARAVIAERAEAVALLRTAASP